MSLPQVCHGTGGDRQQPCRRSFEPCVATQEAVSEWAGMDALRLTLQHAFKKQLEASTLKPCLILAVSRKYCLLHVLIGQPKIPEGTAGENKHGCQKAGKVEIC